MWTPSIWVALHVRPVIGALRCPRQQKQATFKEPSGDPDCQEVSQFGKSCPSSEASTSRQQGGATGCKNRACNGLHWFGMYAATEVAIFAPSKTGARSDHACGKPGCQPFSAAQTF